MFLLQALVSEPLINPSAFFGNEAVRTPLCGSRLVSLKQNHVVVQGISWAKQPILRVARALTQLRRHDELASLADAHASDGFVETVDNLVAAQQKADGMIHHPGVRDHRAVDKLRCFVDEHRVSRFGDGA